VCRAGAVKRNQLFGDTAARLDSLKYSGPECLVVLASRGRTNETTEALPPKKYLVS
jgi:hypothetical protein